MAWNKGVAVVSIRINGQLRELDVDPEMPLLWAIRDHAGLTGTKYGCGIAQCGACTVQVDGRPTRACRIPVGAVGEASVTTIEGLESPMGNALQQAWIEEQVPQCGYCQSGQIMSAEALLARNPAPDDDAINLAMRGNVCRCATYPRIRRAIKRASSSLQQGGEAGE